MRWQILVLVFILINTFSVSAEIYNFNENSDKLEINEEFGDVIPVITSTELTQLEGLSISTDQGTTSTKQYIRFGNAAATLTSPKINYIKSNGEVIDSFIYIAGGTTSTDAFAEYELEFKEGFESTITEKNLDDYDDAKLKIFADTYTIIDTSIDTSSSKVTLLMSTSAASNFIKEGETVIYQLGNKKYEVNVKTISNTPIAATLAINGEDIGKLEEDDTYELADGTVIGIRRVIKSSGSAPNMVGIFIGSQTVKFEDHYNDDAFEQGYSVNKKKISDGLVSIKGTVTSDVFKMTSLKLRFLAPAEVYIGSDESLSEKLSDERLLLGNWDINNKGFNEVAESNIKIKSSGSSNYDIYFENQDKKKYKFPFYTAGGTLGDETNAFRIVEGSSTGDFVIPVGDYFILSTGAGKNDKSYVLKYNNVDTTNKKIFLNEMLSDSTDTITATYSSSNVSGAQGQGVITVGGNGFDFYIENATATRLAVDQNKDGDIASDQIDMVVYGGGIMDLGTTNSPGASYTLKLTTLASSFEESSSDEAITFEITGGTEVGVTSTSFTNIVLYNLGEKMTGMSDYGIEYILTNINTGTPEELEINYPLSQRFANVNIELLESSGSTATTTLQEGTCSDGIQNGDETGVDCGGSCSKDCTDVSNSTTNQTVNQEPPKKVPGQDTSSAECPFGCLYVDKEDKVVCLKINEIIDKSYCESEGNLVEQRENGAVCKKDISCISGTCKDSVCTAKYGIIPTSLNVILIVLVIIIFLKVHTNVKE
ncbi:MAG: hypothetical protein Q8Q42_01905 [Nanoarchaeota archaeon]|nr:hypothetical protein [Nanoarchaeota archaeon]